MLRRQATTLSIAATLILSFAGYAAAADATPTAPPEPQGMKPIFDGKTLDGWDGDPKLWSVKDGMIHGETTADYKFQGNQFLIWKGGEPGDFELRLSFRLDPEKTGEGNSGVMYRSKHIAEGNDAKNKWVMGGYQAEIANVPGKDGFLYQERGNAKLRHRAEETKSANEQLYMARVGEKVAIDEKGVSNVVGSIGDRDEIGKNLHKNDWNDYVIIARGNHLQHFINGVQTIDAVDNDPKGSAAKGLIGLQIHNGKPMIVDFKNVRIKEYDSAGGEKK
jgi:hypothetical protein